LFFFFMQFFFFPCNFFCFFVKAVLLNIILTSQTNTCHTHIFTGDHDVFEKNTGVHIFDGK
jgi:hypothetical protein